MPTDRPVPPEARNRRSSRRTSRTPAATRWNAMEAPVTPPPMTLLGHAREVAALEDRHDVRARAREARHLEHDCITEAQVAPRNDGRPVEPLDGDVLADGAGHDRVSLGSKLVDRLHGVEAYGTLRTSVVLPVAVCVALEPQRGDPCRRYRRLRDAARRDADLYDSSVHPRPPWRASARAPRLYASAATRGRARGASCRPGSPHVRVSSADARVPGTGGWPRPGHGRGAVSRRAATPSGFR